MEELQNKTGRALLVVDDEEDVGVAMKAVLVRAGYAAEWASDGQAALARAREKVYDLIFLDIYLPGMTGLETFRELKKLHPGSKVCIMTGWPKGVSEHTEDCLAMLREGAIDRMLRKPFSAEEILRAAKDILGE